MSHADPRGTTLDAGALFAERYQITGVLGRGGMGAVYRARDLALGEDIALKVLAQAGEAGVAEVMRFRQEVRLARRVTHANVARVYDIGEHDGVVYLTMELVAGETLRQILRRSGSLPPAEAVRIAIALAEGLGAAHASSVVHRDLKPANVLVEQGGRVVITDFGIARSLSEASQLTVGVIGTPTYMAPEQLFSGTIDARTDLYALGLVLHEMLTGTKPENGAPSPKLPAPIAELVRRCIAPAADARPGSAAEVARVLRALDVAREAPIAATPPIDDSAEPTVARSGSRPIEAPSAPASAAPLTSTGVTREPALAVLPFRYRGPKEEEGLGDAITDELVDVLARTRGLRVLGSSATAQYRDARDPRTVGRELGAAAVIDGSAQLGGERVRITVRLIEAATGVQLWNERYDSDLGDLLALQETIAHRVAEELRLTITTLTHRGSAPAAAVEHYLAGRQRLRAFDFEGAAAAAASLERCLALAPDFAPALAAHAIASLRCWFFDTDDSSTNWEARARASVSRAAERAPDLPESHLAGGILAAQGAEYRAAARCIEKALAIAPTYADAHEYLGMLQCEAGRGAEGIRRLRLAASLAPSLQYAGVFIARHHALHGRWNEFEAALAEAQQRHGHALARLVIGLRARAAGWRGDTDTLRRILAEENTFHGPTWRFVRIYAGAITGQLDRNGVREQFARILANANNPRFASLAMQLGTEVHAALGDIPEAELHLSRAATSVLVDLEWLDRCPLLAPLRDLPSFVDVRRRVRMRAESIWAT